jgi:hypothetical protein
MQLDGAAPVLSFDHGGKKNRGRKLSDGGSRAPLLS